MTNQRRPRGDGYVFEKDGKWHVRLYIGGRRLKRTVATQREALEVRDKMKSDVGQGVTPSQITVGKALDEFMAHGCTIRGWRAATIESYESVIRLYLRPMLGTRKLGELTVPDVQRMLDGLTEAGRSPRYASHVRGVLRSALAHSERLELVGRNVAALATTPAQLKPEFTALSVAQVHRLLKELEGHRLRAVIVVAAFLGLRRGECIALRWEDVDLEAGTLTVRRTGNRRGRRYIEGPPKSARSKRTLMLPAMLAKELREHRALINAERLRLGSAWADEGRCFPGDGGGPLGATTLRGVLANALDRAGLPSARIHDLRHSAASNVLADGGSLLDAQELLGHSSATLTANTYAHIMDSQRRATADRIEKMMGG
jgi:integrase